MHLGMLGMLPQEAPNAGTCRHGLEAPPLPPQEGLSMSKCRPKRAPQMPLPPPPREGSGEPGLLPQEAPNEGMCRHRPEVSSLPPPRDSLLEGEHWPQWVLQGTP